MTDSFRLGQDGIYRCDAFQQFLWQEHGFGTKQGSPTADVSLRQVHSDQIVNAATIRDREQEGDALITDQVGLSIGVRTADCVPLLMLDRASRTIAAVHAGWRGTAAEIAKRAVEKFASAFRGKSDNLFVAIGPCIRGCCYEVGEEVSQHFAQLFPEWGDADRAKRKIDLVEANRRQLSSVGVPATQIFDSCLCTACLSTQFFSYRREPENPGRLISAIKRLA